MEIQRPFRAITPSVDGDVLNVLASAQAMFTVTQLSSMVPDRSSAGLRNALVRLSAQGVVIQHQIGKSSAFSLNADHLAADAIRQIASFKSRFLDRLHRHVSLWEAPPRYGALFGSAARGDMREDSDIDILLVSPDHVLSESWLTNVADLAEAATLWTGNDTRVIEMTEADVLSTPNTPLFNEILTEGIVFTEDPDWLRQILRVERAS